MTFCFGFKYGLITQVFFTLKTHRAVPFATLC